MSHDEISFCYKLPTETHCQASIVSRPGAVTAHNRDLILTGPYHLSVLCSPSSHGQASTSNKPPAKLAVLSHEKEPCSEIGFRLLPSYLQQPKLLLVAHG